MIAQPRAVERAEPCIRPSYDCGLRIFDLVLAVPALLLAAAVAAVLLVLNPIFNPGPLFYRQIRMGKGGEPFVMWKFRSMTEMSQDQARAVRDPNCALEHDLITPLGRILRRTRIDELPNFVNVVRGEMSVIGPRPDTWQHAVVFVQSVPYYRNRFKVRPGITGVAQVRGGYADSPRAIQRKARFDHYYVRRASLMLAVYVVWQTVYVMLTGHGAK